ncbi:phosphatase PAP2 family protein [uncultured Bacteroides sp.]|uniref:phosphatase PAP2 family protein n=1 Tax=uncultured Bacteroides sp. TaxID=162156 RepID=UPI0025949B35|nr:phosphatase PAP2 family protein [uncultured Bacteroides sp.]
MDINLKLLDRVESGKGLFAVESISLIYNALTSILILILYTRMDHPGIMLLERLGIVALTFALMYLYRAYPCRLTAFVRMAVQMSLLAYWYPDTYEFNRVFDNLDHIFAAMEQSLFECQPSVEFSKYFPSIWFSEPLNMGYFFYYPMMLILVVYYFVNHYMKFEKVCFVLVTSFFIYYLFYLLVPVAGPQFYFPAIGMDRVNACEFLPLGDYFNYNVLLFPAPGYEHGFFYNLVEASQEIGERPTAAFPSSHVAISTIVMIMSSKVSRKLTYFLLPFYILLCLATVYIQAHYLIDSIVGFISAFFVYRIAVTMYDKWFITPTFK